MHKVTIADRTGKTSDVPRTPLFNVRLNAYDRALLAKLVELEEERLRDNGVIVSEGSVVRGLIRAAARAAGIAMDEAEHATSTSAAPKRKRSKK